MNTVNDEAAKNQKDEIHYADSDVQIDGKANEEIWDKVSWQQLDQRWLGEPYTENDFSGKYKLAWDENYVYVLAEVVDDTLIDIHPDGLNLYWDDDCLEIFIDEDASGGDHQYNHQAFAYHISLDQRVTDMGVDSSAVYFDDHLDSFHRREGKKSTWEVRMKLFDDSFKEGKKNTPVKLEKEKEIGFALAYCDNDTSDTRENFIGSEVVEGEDKNRGWIDAGIFRKYQLIE
ncbi:MAG TPA: sugar-binding protein [Bacteroidales bacterium]|nr:sugar-binding protein [Bacteroidales bacterium]